MTRIARHEDWPARLDALLRAAAARRFAFGEHDCALFAAQAVEAMTGVDPGAGFIGRYKTKRGAAGALKRAGGTLFEVAQAFAAGLGAVEINPVLASRGDIAYVEIGGDAALAVVDLAGRLVTTGPGTTGLLTVPREAALRVWRIG